ncbi:MAG: SRPBCC domain-containing protein [Candidatus Acidiferrales bacterium]
MQDESLARFESIFRIDLDRRFDQTPERVWETITDSSHVSDWMKYPARIDPHLGGAIFVDFTPDEPLSGLVCKWEPAKSFAHTWGDSIVEWRIAGDLAGARLRLSHIGVRPKFLVGLATGWHTFLDQLEAYLRGETRPDRFKEFEARYKEAFDPLLNATKDRA